MFKFKGIPVHIIAIVLAIVAIVVGIWSTFFEGRGYLKTEATITNIETDYTGEDTTQTVTVDYDVDGTHYSEELGFYTPSYKVGKVIEIRYNPENPAKITSAGVGFGIYLLAVGILILAVIIGTWQRGKKALREQQEAQPATGYAPSFKGEERELYFLTDSGTAKYGHRIEDKDRRVLYEAKVTKFTLLAPTHMDFIDHVNNRTTQHLVGHEESNENNSLLLDNYYTFKFDGQDIWDHLKDNGIRIDPGIMEGKMLWLEFHVYRNGEEFAYIQTSSPYVHEEDAEAKSKIIGSMPTRGHYRIWTREQNLDLLFVVLLAFARTEAADGDGGAMHGFIRKKK